MDPDQILRTMDTESLVGLVHQILHLIEREPLLSERVFRVFGYSRRHVKTFVNNLEKQLDNSIKDLAVNDSPANKEALIELIKSVYGAQFIREIKRASMNPEVHIWYEQMPNVSNTNTVATPDAVKMPEVEEKRETKRTKESRATLTGESYKGRPRFADTSSVKKGGRRTRVKRNSRFTS